MSCTVNEAAFSRVSAVTSYRIESLVENETRKWKRRKMMISSVSHLREQTIAVLMASSKSDFNI